MTGLGGDASVIGQTIWLSDQPYVIAGVINRGFTGPTQGEIRVVYVEDEAVPAEQSVPVLSGKERWQVWRRSL